MSTDPAVLRLAEDLNANLPPSPGSELIDRDRYAIWLGDGLHPAYTVVQRLRLTADGVEQAVREVRELLAARGRRQATWEVGPSATPADVHERLLALGMQPFEEPLAVGMVFDAEPDWPAPEVEARRAETVDEYVAVQDVLDDAFGSASGDPAARQRAAEERLERDRTGSSGARYLAFLHGEPVAAATATFTPHAVVLGGAATREPARGRGAYRALIAARRADGVARGTPALVVQAGALSRPILGRLGFREVAEVRILLDELHG